MNTSLSNFKESDHCLAFALGNGKVRNTITRRESFGKILIARLKRKKPRNPFHIRFVGETLRIATVCLLFLASSALISEAQTPPPSEPEASPNSHLFTGRIQRNSQRVEETEKLNKRLLEMLALIPQPASDALAVAQSQSQELAFALAAAEGKLKDFQRANPTNSTSVADLQKELADAERTRDRLVNMQTDQLSLQNPTNGTKGIRREVTLTNLHFIPILLLKNRVVPIMEPFFEITPTSIKDPLTQNNVNGIGIRRVDPGEPIAKALDKDGLLYNFIKNSKTSEDYFKFIVCSDSIQAFNHAVDAVSARGFIYSWVTGRDQDIFQRSGNATESHTDRGYLPPKGP
jgi:hypothetical protein